MYVCIKTSYLLEELGRVLIVKLLLLDNPFKKIHLCSGRWSRVPLCSLQAPRHRDKADGFGEGCKEWYKQKRMGRVN